VDEVAVKTIGGDEKDGGASASGEQVNVEGLEKVRLAAPGGTGQEEGFELGSGVVGKAADRAIGQLIAQSDNREFKG